MKSFFPTFLASFLGVFAAFALCIFVLIGIGISGMANAESYSADSVLKLTLEDFIPEKTDNIDEQTSMFGGHTEAIGLRRTLKLIETAAKDSKIKGILLENNHVSVGQASILELREGLEKFK
ncbi:MAG: hypothetical protein WBO36_16515, partial [Saprospiraceae bacterium]